MENIASKPVKASAFLQLISGINAIMIKFF